MTSQKASTAARWFYPACAWVVLGITLYGFQHFYFHGQAFPGRPLTPPIKTLLIVHGVAMLLWVLLFILQPMLIAMKKRRLHVMIGRSGAVLALALVVTGWLVGILAARVNPPDLVLFGMLPPQFLYVPLTAISVYGVMVVLAIAFTDRPALHRGLMLMGTLSALSAALGRINWVNDPVFDTLWFGVFGQFHSVVALALILLAVRCVLVRGMDWGLGLAVAGLMLVYVLMKPFSETAAWDSFARMLMGAGG